MVISLSVSPAIAATLQSQVPEMEVKHRPGRIALALENEITAAREPEEMALFDTVAEPYADAESLGESD